MLPKDLLTNEMRRNDAAQRLYDGNQNYLLTEYVKLRK
jgi:hypothetical protein